VKRKQVEQEERPMILFFSRELLIVKYLLQEENKGETRELHEQEVQQSEYELRQEKEQKYPREQ
jgi:hypothetical protein